MRFAFADSPSGSRNDKPSDESDGKSFLLHTANLKEASDLGTRAVDDTSRLLERAASLRNPERLRDVTAERLSHFQTKLREEGRAESTIEGYLAHFKAALNWAVIVGMIPKAPKIVRPKRAKTGKVMKGRPLVGEEFDRMLEKCASVVGDDAAASWKFYLRGLWTSGLRLEESLELWWDRDDRLSVDMSQAKPMLRIPAALGEGQRGPGAGNGP